MKLQGGEVQMALWLINTTDDPLFYSLLYFFLFFSISDSFGRDWCTDKPMDFESL